MGWTKSKTKEVIDSKRPYKTISTRENRWLEVEIYSTLLYFREEFNEMQGWVFDAFIDYVRALES